VHDLYYNAEHDRLMASSRNSDFVYIIDPNKLTWKWRVIGGYRIQLIRAAGDRMLGASLYDGVVVESPAAGVQTSRK
jgi:hypothetical protein